ncbi:hypothetical protein MMC31_004168 [Peltigera leucophlebia]|nr:hypothetical protein [Peltigera leucophlebia]
MAPITYEWKLKLETLKSQEEKLTLLQQAYKTVHNVEPNPVKILIRSIMHGTTKRYGKITKDGDHITVSYKTDRLNERGRHQTLHGYYPKSGNDETIPGKNTGSDAFRPIGSNRPLWPRRLISESHIGRPTQTQWEIAKK